MVGASFGWLVLVFSTFQAARRNLLEWQQRKTRPAKFAGWQRRYVDIFLLFIGTVSYWQLTTSGSFIMRRIRDTDMADPLLLLSPTILIIALAMLFLRIFPFFLQLGARLARTGRGLTWSLGLSRLARTPVQPSRVVLLISLATGLSLFAISFARSLAQSQIEIARYLAGADLRISSSNYSLESIQNIPGVLHSSPVFRSAVTNAEGKLITILVIETDTFSQVAANYPQGMTNLTIDTVVSGLRTDQNTPTGSENEPITIPGIFSKSAIGEGTDFGGVQEIKFNVHTLPVHLRGLIRNFPTLSGAFILVDKNSLEKATDLKIGQIYRSEEVWVTIDPNQYLSVVEHPIITNAIIADASKILRGMQNNTFMKGSQQAFLINALILSILSIASFFFVSYFAARKRAYEFGILQALGLSSKNVAGLMLGEGILVLFFGLFSGVGIGIAMTRMMRPYLNQILAKVIPNTVVYQIDIDWDIILPLIGGMIFFYMIALLIALVSILRTDTNRVMRMGDE